MRRYNATCVPGERLLRGGVEFEECKLAAVALSHLEAHWLKWGDLARRVLAVS